MNKLASSSTLLLFSLLSLLVTLVVVMFASTYSSNVSHHHQQNILFSIFRFIVEAKSNPWFVFFMCNVIVILILLGSFRPLSDEELISYFDHNHHQSSTLPLLVRVVDHHQYPSLSAENIEIHRTEEEILEEKKCDDAYEDYESGVLANEEEQYDGDDDDNSTTHMNNSSDTISDEDQSNEQEDEEEGGDDLKIRVEEFIAKINNGWRDEWLRDKLCHR